MVEQVSEQVSEQASGRVAILGAGNMGGTILAGLLRAGRGPADVVVSARRPERAAELRRQHGIEVLDNVSAAAWGDTVLIAVKPRDVSGLLKEISPALRPGTLVVSLAAGQTIAALESDLPEGTPVIRVMPNTPSLVDQGMSVLSPSEHCRPEHTERAQELLSATGKVLQVPEAYQDAVTAVSGSGRPTSSTWPRR